MFIDPICGDPICGLIDKYENKINLNTFGSRFYVQNICASLDALRLRRGSLKFLFYKGASEPWSVFIRNKEANNHNGGLAFCLCGKKDIFYYCYRKEPYLPI